MRVSSDDAMNAVDDLIEAFGLPVEFPRWDKWRQTDLLSRETKRELAAIDWSPAAVIDCPTPAIDWSPAAVIDCPTPAIDCRETVDRQGPPLEKGISPSGAPGRRRGRPTGSKDSHPRCPAHKTETKRPTQWGALKQMLLQTLRDKWGVVPVGERWRDGAVKSRPVWRCGNGHQFAAGIECMKNRIKMERGVCLECGVVQHAVELGQTLVNPIPDSWTWVVSVWWECTGCGRHTKHSLSERWLCPCRPFGYHLERGVGVDR